jgi:acetyl esterase
VAERDTPMGMGRLLQFLVDTTLRLPAPLLIRLSGAPQRELAHRRLLPEFQFLDAQMSRAPGLESMEPREARAMFRDQPISLEAPLSNPPKTRDHSVNVRGGAISVREYVPTGITGDLPALVYFHGGGWVIGDLDSHDSLCARLCAEAGVRVFSADYRLAPEFKFPTPLDDCDAAFEWILENTNALKIDPSRIAAGGDSAGGNLTAALCLRRKSEAKTLPYLQLLLYPVTDLNLATGSAEDCAEGPVLTLAAMHWFRGHYLNSAEEWDNPLVSPLLATNLSGLPSAIVITAGFDPLRDEGDAYAERLTTAGVPVFHHSYDAFIHGFANMSRISDARIAVDEIAEKLAQKLA